MTLAGDQKLLQSDHLRRSSTKFNLFMWIKLLCFVTLAWSVFLSGFSCRIECPCLQNMSSFDKNPALFCQYRIQVFHRPTTCTIHGFVASSAVSARKYTLVRSFSTVHNSWVFLRNAQIIQLKYKYKTNTNVNTIKYNIMFHIKCTEFLCIFQQS